MSTDPVLTVQSGQLIEMLTVLIRRVEEVSDGESVPIGEDFFWSVPLGDMHDVYAGPPQLTVGQVTESWSELTEMLSNDRPVPYGLVWLSDVLRAIAASAKF